jgi:hypothetical protein
MHLKLIQDSTEPVLIRETNEEKKQCRKKFMALT